MKRQVKGHQNKWKHGDRHDTQKEDREENGSEIHEKPEEDGINCETRADASVKCAARVGE